MWDNFICYVYVYYNNNQGRKRLGEQKENIEDIKECEENVDYLNDVINNHRIAMLIMSIIFIIIYVKK